MVQAKTDVDQTEVAEHITYERRNATGKASLHYVDLEIADEYISLPSIPKKKICTIEERRQDIRGHNGVVMSYTLR